MSLLNDARANSTRPFKARGVSVARCQRCMLGVTACICSWRVSSQLELEVIVIMHHDEIFKPTNTGRLIGDIFPHNTAYFEWSRTAPEPELLAIIEDPNRQCVLLFPNPDANKNLPAKSIANGSNIEEKKRLTLIVLDGTWRQAKKMSRSSSWLDGLPNLELNFQNQSEYGVRHAPKSGQLSTAEASAQALHMCGETLGAQLLSDYFLVFAEHYLATRKNVLPSIGEHHLRLQEYSENSPCND